MEFLVFSRPDNVSGLTKLIGNLITSVGAVWLGIIIFTVVLKLITLIFDYYSRASMRKSSLKMKEMRPQLEKLQVQFKDNKELYQQKVMALYKKEGYSTFAACLPTIFTLVFFILVISAFNQYSTYSKISVFNEMAISYSESVRTNDDVVVYECKTDANGVDEEPFYDHDGNKDTPAVLRDGYEPIAKNSIDRNKISKYRYYAQSDKIQNIKEKYTIPIV